LSQTIAPIHPRVVGVPVLRVTRNRKLNHHHVGVPQKLHVLAARSSGAVFDLRLGLAHPVYRMERDASRDLQGILNLDKPAGLTSARVVSRVKRLLPRGTKIGHAGTLDPFATGVLLLLIGKATKLCEQLMDSPKQYEAVIKFGATTATDDPESPEEPIPASRPPAPRAWPPP